MSDPDQLDAARSLAEILLENKLLSQAQIDLAIADQEINDLPLEEILLVRGWISRDKLYQVAPWLKPGAKQQAPAPRSKSGEFINPSLGKSSEFAKSSPGRAGEFTRPDFSGTGSYTRAVPGKPGADSKLDTGKSSSFSRDTSAKPDTGKNDFSSSGTRENIRQPAATTSSGAAAVQSSQSTTTDRASPASKPGDIRKGQPVRPDGNAMFTSPVKSDREQNLKAYKEVLKKILAVDKES